MRHRVSTASLDLDLLWWLASLLVFRRSVSTTIGRQVHLKRPRFHNCWYIVHEMEKTDIFTSICYEFIEHKVNMCRNVWKGRQNTLRQNWWCSKQARKALRTCRHAWSKQKKCIRSPGQIIHGDQLSLLTPLGYDVTL